MEDKTSQELGYHSVIDKVKQSTQRVMALAEHVSIDRAELVKLAGSLCSQPSYIDYFDYSCHISAAASTEEIVNFIFVLDSLNFCFWPTTWEYEDISSSIKRTGEANPDCLTPKGILKMAFEDFRKLFFEKKEFVQLEERFRVLRDVAQVAMKHFEGSFMKVVERARESAVELVEIISMFFYPFQDHTVYKGAQVFFYKRAQILVGDLHAAFMKVRPDLKFKDISQLTCFADYRIPQVLNSLGIMKYGEKLQEKVDKKKEIGAGSQEEVEIRAGLVQSVEMIREEMAKKGVERLSIEIDWLLWQKGEAEKDKIKEHHRVFTIYY